MAGDSVARDGARAPAVVLLHGWNGRPAHWRPIAAGLGRSGYAVFVPHLPLQPFRETVCRDAAVLDGFLRQTLHGGRPLAEQPVVLAGYSRGGLVARAYVRLYGWEHVAGMVHVAVPHFGCRNPYPEPLAMLLRHCKTDMDEMMEGSEFLSWLNADPRHLGRVPQLAVVGRASMQQGYNDLVVWEESATLGGRLRSAVIDFLPEIDAWHGNLINRYWYHLPQPQYAPSDRCWPLTLGYMLAFLPRLPGW